VHESFLGSRGRHGETAVVVLSVMEFTISHLRFGLISTVQYATMFRLVGKNDLGSVSLYALKGSLINRSLITSSGRELGSYALEEYSSVKAVHWNFGERV